MLGFTIFLIMAAPFVLFFFYSKRAKQKGASTEKPKKKRMSGWKIALIAFGALMVISPLIDKPSNRPVQAHSTSANPDSDSITEASGELKKANQELFIVYAQEAIQRRLKDPESAEFDALYYQHQKATGAHIVCGRVNAKNSFGGYKGFERFVSDARAVNVLESDMKSRAEFNIVWNKLCR